MKRALLFSLLFSIEAVATEPRLYVFDCGLISMKSLQMFNLQDHESSVRQFSVPCYMVEHKQGRLFFDGGLPEKYVDPGNRSGEGGVSMSYDRWIIDQLEDMSLKIADIDYAAFSHLHFDHAGAANAFSGSHVLMQIREWEAATQVGGGFIDPSLISELSEEDLSFIDGDYDVFGDGSVRLIFTPGHTPGHQLLLVDLANTGAVLLSGDLYHTQANRRLRRAPLFNVDAEQTYESMDRVEELLRDSGATLWIGHDKALTDSLKKAPQFYD